MADASRVAPNDTATVPPDDITVVASDAAMIAAADAAMIPPPYDLGQKPMLRLQRSCANHNAGGEYSDRAVPHDVHPLLLVTEPFHATFGEFTHDFFQLAPGAGLADGSSSL